MGASRRDATAASRQDPRVRRRSVLLLAVVLVLLAVVMLTAGGREFSAGSLAVALPRSLGSMVFAAFTALLVVASAVGVLIVYALRPTRRKRKDDEPEWVNARRPLSWVDRLLGVLAPALLAAAVVVAVVLAIHARAGAGAHVVIVPPAGVAVAPSVGAEVSSGSVQNSWGVVGLAVGGLVVAGGVVAFLLARRRATPRPGAASGEAGRVVAAVARAAGLSLDDVRRERDPRRAILAAYARMESLFAAEGLVRPSSDTQSEYLAGVLHASSAPPDALLDLTLLFEEARFSSHRMSVTDREEAISALVRISEALT